MADQEHMFTGVVKLWPGSVEAEHIHDTPMAYYIIEVNVHGGSTTLAERL